jgi:hypothetical protein
MYPEFADKADEEGFDEIASAMRSIAIAEKQHEKRHLALLKNIESKKVFKRDGEEMAIPSIAPEECMYIGSLRCGPHPPLRGRVRSTDRRGEKGHRAILRPLLGFPCRFSLPHKGREGILRRKRRERLEQRVHLRQDEGPSPRPSAKGRRTLRPWLSSRGPRSRSPTVAYAGRT